MSTAATNRQISSAEEPHSSREAIICAAAACFMETGFSASSIDDVAKRLGATKGMIYHYFRSKADIFFEVHRKGMEINLGSIEPLVKLKLKPKEKLHRICRSHLRNMLIHLDFQRVVMQGVDMHLFGSTTPAQREKLRVLMDERERYEGLIREVLVQGRKDGEFDFTNPSLASKAVLAILNNPVIWYSAKADESEQDRQQIIEEFSNIALNSVTVKNTSVRQPENPNEQ